MAEERKGAGLLAKLGVVGLVTVGSVFGGGCVGFGSYVRGREMPLQNSSYVEVEPGLDIHYFRRGCGGRNIVIVPGYCECKENWEYIASKLSERNTVYVVDAEGFGKSDESRNYTVEHSAKSLAEFLEKMNLDNVVLVGHSMGASIADVASCYETKRIKKIIHVGGWIDRAHNKFDTHDNRVGLLRIPFLSELLQLGVKASLTRETLAEGARRYTFNERRLPDFFIKNVYNYLQSREHFKTAVWRGLNFHPEKYPRNPDIEYAFIYGRQDPLHKLCNPGDFGSLNLYIIEACGHFVHQEKPDELVGILRFLVKYDGEKDLDEIKEEQKQRSRQEPDRDNHLRHHGLVRRKWQVR